MGEAGIETTLTSDFYIDRYEVSVRAYNECVRARKCPKAEQVMGMSSSDPESFSKEWSARCNARRNEPDHPMNCVQLSAAEGYCAFREKRLPTEAEWELSARGKEGRKYPWGGGDAQCDTSCFDRNGGSCTRATEGIVTCAAGSHAEDRTPDLVYDMAGNVSEWTQDGFGDLLGGKDPVRKGGDARVVRGGNFAEGSEALLATHRAGFSAGAAHVTVGFRCAVSVPTVP